MSVIVVNLELELQQLLVVQLIEKFLQIIYKEIVIGCSKIIIALKQKLFKVNDLLKYLNMNKPYNLKIVVRMGSKWLIKEY